MSHLEKQLTEILGKSFVDSCEKLVKTSLDKIPETTVKPKDVCHNIPMNLGQFCTDYTITLKAAKRLPCKRCTGLGTLKESCLICRGARYNNVFMPGSSRRAGSRQVPCATCKATGMVSRPCSNCKGKQADLVENVFSITIPKGSFNGTKVRLAGKGDSLLTKPETSSDIVCTAIEQPHPIFKRVFNDLYMFKTISLRQAICGFVINIKHVDGRKIALICKPGEVTKPGCYKCAKNQGMPVAKSTKRGDLYVLFNVKFPTILKSALIPDVKAVLNDMKCPGEVVTGAHEHEEVTLTNFDPKEQIYNVPFRQSTAYSSQSPMKKNDNYSTIPESCKQQ